MFVRISLSFLCVFLFVTEAEAQSSSFNRRISFFQTRFARTGSDINRAHNIRRTVQIISVRTLSPNQNFSFNRVIGQRTSTRGFRSAPVISSRRIVRGMGGGVCQTASTIYAAALYAGLSIVEHHGHSRPSHYIRLGLDATVNWSNKDLVIRNPYSFSIQIRVSIIEKNRFGFLRVEIFAPTSVPRVSIRFVSRQRSQPRTIVRPSTNLSPGSRRILSPGTPRIYVVAIRTFQLLGGFTPRFRQRFEHIYEASDRIILVGIAR